MEIYRDEALKLYGDFKSYVNNSCKNLEAFEIILYTCCITWALSFLWFYIHRHRSKGAFQRLKEWVFRIVRKVPFVRERIKVEISKISRQIEILMFQSLEGRTFIQQLPKNGLSKEEILKKVHEYHKMGKIDVQGGKVSGAVYKSEDPNLRSLVSEVYHSMAWTNPLHPDVFPNVRKMEAEIVRMVCNLYNGDEGACGTVTTGGTESIFMACKAYRDYAIAERGIEHPEMIVPLSAHAAFDKAGQILQVKVVHIPLDPVTVKVNLKAMRAAINRNTCMIVGSSPNFPYGIIDPIEDIAKLGVKYNVPVHVDACLGGFLVPFMKDAGFEIPPFDFSVDGVMSISCDTHKYGYAPKGTSLIMYRNQNYIHHQFSIMPDWPGGIYATPTLGGSRAGGTIGTCWASLLYYGYQGYVDSTKKIIETTRFIDKSLREIPEIYVFGQPQMSLVALGSDHFDIYRLSHALGALGWSFNSIQFPSGFHLCVTQLHTQPGVAQQLVQDVRQCVKAVMKDPKAAATGTAAIYGMAQGIPDRTFVSEIACAFLDAYYNTSCTDNKKKKESKKSS